jgi:hypothetical protein
MTTPSPYPVSEADTATAASKFTGVAAWTQTSSASGSVPAYLLTGPGALAVVDGVSGRAVLYAVLAPDVAPSDGLIPVWSPAPAAPDTLDAAGAEAAAATWATAHGFSPDPYATTQLFEVAGVSGWRVSLDDAANVPFEIRVVGGKVAGVLVMDGALDLRLPVVDRDTAIGLALATARQVTGNTAEQLISAQFEGGVMNGRLTASWFIATGVPAPSASDSGPAWELGIAAGVDAVTGEVIVDKGP